MGILYAGEKVVANDDDDDSSMACGDLAGVIESLSVNSPIAVTVDEGIVDGALSPTTVVVVVVVVVPKLIELVLLLLTLVVLLLLSLVK